jgi:hypothetical protein
VQPLRSLLSARAARAVDAADVPNHFRFRQRVAVGGFEFDAQLRFDRPRKPSGAQLPWIGWTVDCSRQITLRACRE